MNIMMTEQFHRQSVMHEEKANQIGRNTVDNRLSAGDLSFTNDKKETQKETKKE